MILFTIINGKSIPFKDNVSAIDLPHNVFILSTFQKCNVIPKMCDCVPSILHVTWFKKIRWNFVISRNAKIVSMNFNVSDAFFKCIFHRYLIYAFVQHNGDFICAEIKCPFIMYGVYILVEVSIHISTTWWVSLLVDQGVPKGTCNQVLRSTSVDLSRFESIKIFCVKIDRNCNFVGLLHHPVWLKLLSAVFGHHISIFQLLSLAKDLWRGFNTRNAHMVYIINSIRFEMVYTS